LDEVHLLNDERGAVIEAIVARTLRMVEASQSRIRLVGLSATLPNYSDVAVFLRVNPKTDLFPFDSTYRPVPLTQQFVGVSDGNPMQCQQNMMIQAYERALQRVQLGHQVMIFVHSRKDTYKTARAFVDQATQGGCLAFFNTDVHSRPALSKAVDKSRSRELQQLFACGFGMHHAGMLRPDRKLTEDLFKEGAIKVLVCTATLAWGVNLPAHTVIIKGTEIYDAKAGTFIELSILDVMQIFGRAGRPQFDSSGEGIIITKQKCLSHYLALMNNQVPIESRFNERLCDHLNAEIVLGTVTNIKEGVSWLAFTYLYIRMVQNPLAYGITHVEMRRDPTLAQRRKDLIIHTAKMLDEARMIRYDDASGNVYVTDLGRIASHYYIQHASIIQFNLLMSGAMSQGEALKVFGSSSEFSNLQSREDEMDELETLRSHGCPVKGKFDLAEHTGKACILLQSYVSRCSIDGFALTADCNYVSSNAGRIFRALFEISLRRGWVTSACTLLALTKAVDRRLWPSQSPLRQVNERLSDDLMSRLEVAKLTLHRIRDMTADEIGAMLHRPAAGREVKALARLLPHLECSVKVVPITRSILRMTVTIQPDFDWNPKFHGGAEPFWIWVEDTENPCIYHSEYWVLARADAGGPQTVTFNIPVFEPLPSQYILRIVSDRWHGCEEVMPVSFKQLMLPLVTANHTKLLPLLPLPVSALADMSFQRLYRFTHFNPIQTQTFHTLYHTDENVLIGAPTGSGKTNMAELAMLRVLRVHKGRKVVYIAPLKALVRERMEDWTKRLGAGGLGLKVAELTGDVTPDAKTLMEADVVLTTPEKWDGISRDWRHRGYVAKVALTVIDEIHLLGEDRGPILEVIVSRMRYISSRTSLPVRVVGLSTAISNAADVADWLGIGSSGLFNFHPSVRPVPLECHIQGFEGKHYCPRMATMNKPAYAAIRAHSSQKPTLIFVSSRRQTRLTALDIVAYAMADDMPRQFLNMTQEEADKHIASAADPSLKQTLQFGIGLHHAGLCDSDRKLVESLFFGCKIGVLCATATLAWGVNLPAHLVIIKGTEFFDGKTKRYVDMPITDVLQMIGRAGRPQFDTLGKAVIMVHEPKKSFYRRFLYEPFPIESALHLVLPEHLNAEIESGTIECLDDAVDYLSWTFFFRHRSPPFYACAFKPFCNPVVSIRYITVQPLCLLLLNLEQAPPNQSFILRSVIYRARTSSRVSRAARFQRNHPAADIVLRQRFATQQLLAAVPRSHCVQVLPQPSYCARVH
jgi:activating signal cointegrator complex subunit 3